MRNIYNCLPKVGKDGYLECVSRDYLKEFKDEDIIKFNDVLTILLNKIKYGKMSKIEYDDWKKRLPNLSTSTMDRAHSFLCKILDSDQEVIIDTATKIRKLRVGKDVDVKITIPSEIIAELNYICTLETNIILNFCGSAFRYFKKEDLLKAKELLQSSEHNQLKEKIKNEYAKRMEEIMNIDQIKTCFGKLSNEMVYKLSVGKIEEKITKAEEKYEYMKNQSFYQRRQIDRYINYRNRSL